MEGWKGGIEMIEKLMHKYALSRQGAKDLIKGVVVTKHFIYVSCNLVIFIC